jgi:hypothetical protein
MKLSLKTSTVGTLAMCFALAGCGGTAQAPGSSSTVSGLASADAPVSTVSLRDSSVPAIERTMRADGDGAFSFEVAGLTPPFALKAVDASGGKLYAVSLQAGRVNLDALSTAAFAATSESDDESDDENDADEDEGWSRYDTRSSARVAESVLGNLRTVLKPLLDHYGVRVGEDMEDSRAFRKMLTEVSFVKNDRILTIANRATAGVIYSAPLNDLISGVLHPENIPGGVVDPGACAYTYSAFGACQAGTQTRTVASSTPAGCTGTPVLSQACVVIPPVGTCTAFTYDAWAPAVCPASGQQTRTAVTSSPAGCTGGSPVLTQNCANVPPVTTCSSFTYTPYAPAVCPANGRQTRTVTSSAPAGCTGGSPVLSQACTYVPPPPDGAALYTQYCSGCHGNGMKGSSVSSINSAIASNRGGMGSLSSLTAAQIAAISAAP